MKGVISNIPIIRYNLMPRYLRRSCLRLSQAQDRRQGAEVPAVGMTGKQMRSMLIWEGLLLERAGQPGCSSCWADRVIHIKNGTVSAMELNTDPTPVEEIEW